MARTAQDKKDFIDALEQSLGVITTACKKTGIPRRTIYNWIESDEDFKAAVDDVGEVAIDFVESQLFKQIKAGNPSSTIFYLKTKAKHRGYVERQEVTGPNGGPIQNEFTGFNFLPDDSDSD